MTKPESSGTPDSPEADGPSCQVRLEPHRHEHLHDDLDHWRANVGNPIAVDGGERLRGDVREIDVLNWNIAIGMGRLDALLARLRDDVPGFAHSPSRPLVILMQEAYRTDHTVPADTGSGHHGGSLKQKQRTDIVDWARDHNLSLRYSPSMRNGAHTSDRGNAILSTVHLEDAHAFLLPYVRQRRVGVSARIAGLPGLTFVSAHLDTHGRLQGDAARVRFGAGRAAQARALAEYLTAIPGSVVLGADLNSVLGMTDPAVRALVSAGMHPARRIGTWRHTIHTPLRLLLDHVLFRSPDHSIVSMSVERIDEAPGDRSAMVFGSDHHPLLAHLRMAG
jgi:endonuclease/exonuclease/phosphatase family metal-dependent hydrolase